MVQYLAQEFRVKVLDVLHDRGTGHWGGAASAAELLVALETRDKKGVQKEVDGQPAVGGLDRLEVKRAVEDIMEGSVEAFRQRFEKYGF